MGLYQTGILHKTVPVSGIAISPVSLQTTSAAIIADLSNSGTIFVSFRSDGSNGLQLGKGAGVTLDLVDLHDIFVSGVAGDGVGVIYKG